MNHLHPIILFINFVIEFSLHLEHLKLDKFSFISQDLQNTKQQFNEQTIYHPLRQQRQFYQDLIHQQLSDQCSIRFLRELF